MKITEKGNGFVELSVSGEGKTLCRTGAGPDVTPVGKVTVRATDAERWEERTLPAYTEAEYKSRVTALIRIRYTADDETSLINNMLDTEPTPEHVAEYRHYQDFRRQCKETARAELSGQVTTAD